ATTPVRASTEKDEQSRRRTRLPRSTGKKAGERMLEILENVVKFSGAPGEDVEEWLSKLDLISGPECLNLNYHDRALLLRLSATGDAYQTVLMVQPDDPKTDPQQRGYLARLRAQLRSRFGNSPDQAINQLCSISLANYRAIDDYAAAITRLVIQASPKTDGACQDEWEKMFFCRGLPRSTSVAIKASRLDDTSTFEEVVDEARLYFDTPPRRTLLLVQVTQHCARNRFIGIHQLLDTFHNFPNTSSKNLSSALR
ncbi:hypothetical protein FOL46_009600, partial [Perkinsus olseni]